MPHKTKMQKVIDKNSQKTKVRAIVSVLGFAGGAQQNVTFASAEDTARVNYYDTYVKPFSKIQMIELDIAIYQDSPYTLDGFVDMMIWKNVGSNVTAFDVTATPIGAVPFVFQVRRCAVPMATGAGMPTIYHLSGKLLIPPRFQTMAPGDKLVISFKGLNVGGVVYSANGQITYMFKV